jgi:hypothetical protein
MTMRVQCSEESSQNQKKGKEGMKQKKGFKMNEEMQGKGTKKNTLKTGMLKQGMKKKGLGIDGRGCKKKKSEGKSRKAKNKKINRKMNKKMG